MQAVITLSMMKSEVLASLPSHPYLKQAEFYQIISNSYGITIWVATGS